MLTAEPLCLSVLRTGMYGAKGVLRIFIGNTDSYLLVRDDQTGYHAIAVPVFCWQFIFTLSEMA